MQVEKKDSDKFTDFVQKNRKAIFITGGVLLLLAAGLVIFLAVYDSLNKKAIIRVEELAARFDELRFSISDENMADDVDSLLEELEAFGKSSWGIAAGRAFSYVGRIYAGREDWPACEEAWRKAFQKGSKTYMAPIALFNAAVAMEEQGSIEQAIDYLQKCVNHPFEFPASPRAQFNIGRLYEQLGDIQAAIEAYRTVLINWQEMPVWQHLARTAIIRLETEINRESE